MNDPESHKEIERQVSTLCFNIQYQAIADALEFSSLHISGSSKPHEVEQAKRMVYEDAREFIFSEEFDAICELARLCFEAPTAGKVRDRVRDFLATGKKKLDMKAIQREAWAIDKQRRTTSLGSVEELGDLPPMKKFTGPIKYGHEDSWASPTAPQKDSKDSKDSKDG